MATDFHRLLVIGASGFLGRRLCQRLCEQEFDVHVLAFGGRNQASRLPSGVTVHGVADSGQDSLNQAVQDADPDIVVNLAAAGVNPEDRAPLTLLDGNAGLLGRLLLASRSVKPKRFLHGGSWLEYAPPAPPRRIDEDHPLLSTSLYGGAKAAATVFGTALARDIGLPFNTLRFFHLLGPGEAATRLSPQVIDRLSRGESCPLSGGEQVRDMVFVDDAVDAILAAASADILPLPVYNVCSGAGVTIRAFVEGLADALDRPRGLLQFGAISYRDGETMWSIGDPSRFFAATGWTPRHTMVSAIKALVSECASVV